MSTGIQENANCKVLYDDARAISSQAVKAKMDWHDLVENRFVQ